MKTLGVYLLVTVCLLVPSLSYTAPPDHAVIYPRLICIVPMIGTGSMQDPYRPLFAPSLQARQESMEPFDESSQIIAFQSVPSDDGKTAIVILVARSYSAFAPIMKDSRVVRYFERDRWKGDDLIRELQKYRKNFEAKMLRIGAL
jgi:hypothetical protein